MTDAEETNTGSCAALFPGEQGPRDHGLKVLHAVRLSVLPVKSKFGVRISQARRQKWCSEVHAHGSFALVLAMKAASTFAQSASV
jgi:hypothetical protein